MTISCIISEIKQDIGKKSQFFSYAFCVRSPGETVDNIFWLFFSQQNQIPSQLRFAKMVRFRQRLKLSVGGNSVISRGNLFQAARAKIFYHIGKKTWMVKQMHQEQQTFICKI